MVYPYHPFLIRCKKKWSSLYSDGEWSSKYIKWKKQDVDCIYLYYQQELLVLGFLICHSNHLNNLCTCHSNHLNNLRIYVCMYLYLCTFGCALSLLLRVGASLQLWCVGFSFLWLLLLQSVGSKAHGLSSCSSWALEHRLSYSVACGIFSEKGTNLCLLHWQEDSLSLTH